MADTCPQCDGEYTKIGNHWARGACEAPTLSAFQKDVITGLMFGDGWINHHHDDANPFFAVGNTNREFLEWFDDLMGVLTTGVKEATGSEFSQKDYYKVRTRRMASLKRFADWYGTGRIVFPTVTLNGTMLKMWFVSDGYLSDWGEGTRPAVVLCNRTQGDRRCYFGQLFQRFDAVPQVGKEQISFRAGDSETLLAAMGEMPPGFSYKLKGHEVAPA